MQSTHSPIHPSIHRTSSQLPACLPPIYHHPPCEVCPPSPKTRRKKGIKKKRETRRTRRRRRNKKKTSNPCTPKGQTPEEKNHSAFPFAVFASPLTTFFPFATPSAAALLPLSYLALTSPFHTVPSHLSQTVKNGCEKFVLIPQLWWCISWYAALLLVICCSGSHGSE